MVAMLSPIFVTGIETEGLVQLARSGLGLHVGEWVSALGVFQGYVEQMVVSVASAICSPVERDDAEVVVLLANYLPCVCLSLSLRNEVNWQRVGVRRCRRG